MQSEAVGHTIQPTTNGTPGLLQRLARQWIYVVVPFAIIILWQAATALGFYRASVLPPPSQVIMTGIDLVTGSSGLAGKYAGSWYYHVKSSLYRVYLGFGWGVALGIALGMFIGLSQAIEKLIDPTIQLLRNIPVTAWLPLSLVFFGIGNPPSIFLIGMGAFFPAVLNTTHGVRQFNRTLYKAAIMMGANRREVIWRAIIPGSLPDIMTGIRLSMGIAWVLVVVAELVAVQSGLGYLLNESYQFYMNDVMLAAMLTIGLLGFLSDRIILLVRNKTLGWSRLEAYDG